MSDRRVKVFAERCDTCIFRRGNNQKGMIMHASDPTPPPPEGDCPQGGDHNWTFSGHIRKCTKCGTSDVAH